MPILMRETDCLTAAFRTRDTYTKARCGRVESLHVQLEQAGKN